MKNSLTLKKFAFYIFYFGFTLMENFTITIKQNETVSKLRSFS